MVSPELALTRKSLACNSLTRKSVSKQLILKQLVLACSLALPLSLSSLALAQDATPATPATPAPATPAPADAGTAPAATAPAADAAAGATATPAPADQGPTDLKTCVDNYWHYGKVARYDLAVAEANKVLGLGAKPEEVLAAFEQTASDRKDNLDDWLLRWQGNDKMKDVTGKLVAVLNQGYAARGADPAAIKSNIERLVNGERAYINGIERLRASGELAVPFMVDYLRDRSKMEYHSAVRRALRDLGKQALNPLLAATEMKDYDTLPIIVTTLGELGYRDAVPYLSKLVATEGTPGPVKTAATDAIASIVNAGNGNTDSNASAGDLFYDLGDRFYYEQNIVKADSRRNVSYIWFWSDDKGLTKVDVPNPIFGDLMAMRSAEYALSLGTSREAQALWLVANYKREVDLPDGQKDATRADNQPTAHFYGVDSGARYLNTALTRALKDHNSAVALKVITSLQQIAGESAALPDGSGPLVNAMQYSDRLVRFEAAFALAGAWPSTPFKGQERVVPLLSEALAQTGQTSVIVLMPKQDDLNGMSEGLKGAGFAVTGGITADAAIAASNGLPAVDVVLTSEDVPTTEIEKLFEQLASSPRLAGASKLIMVKSDASPYVERAANDTQLSTTQSKDAAGLKPAIEESRKKAGSLPIDADTATKYATRAGDLLQKLALSNSKVLEIATAKTTLLASLTDKRPDIVKLSGGVLALVNDKDAQLGLLTAASDDKAADDVKISLYKSLATNAKLYGNQLDASQIDPLNKTVSDSTNNDVKAAAAEAHGALNLPADQAKGLILSQFKH